MLPVVTRAGEGVRLCAAGHVAVCVTRGSRSQWVCPSCLGAAVRGAANRPTTVNDFLAKWEAAGDWPPLRADEADAAQAVIVAAGERCGGQTSEACRALVRQVAKAGKTTTKEVMRWPVTVMRERVAALAG